jgi:GNAT superfamily N-acetyltransferase
VYTIEPARPDDVPRLAPVELAAAALFREHGVPESVLAEATPEADLRAAQADGRLLVARDADGAPVGFAFVTWLDGRPHLMELDVHPDHARRGVGRRLLDAVAGWARARRADAFTLVTFRDVPWNAPFYARAGFRALDAGEIPPELAALMRGEVARGLDPARRVAMLRVVGSR